VKTILLLLSIILTSSVIPAFAQVQSPRSVPLVGVFTHNPKGFERGILKALRELGYTEGKNMVIELKLAKGRQRSSAAAELVRLRPDVIITGGTGATRAIKRATQTIPVVFHLYRDPVRIRLVESFARPGGNITGVTGTIRELRFKMLDLFRESFPEISRLGFIPRRPGRPIPEGLKIAARALGFDPQIVQIKLGKGLGENEDALLGIDSKMVEGITMGGGGRYRGRRKRIVKLVEKSKLPAIYRGTHWGRMGGLMSYGIDKQELGRRVAYLVDRILKGAKPRNLPIERPMKTKFVINLKTAKRQGFKIPPEVLMFADKVIQ